MFKRKHRDAREDVGRSSKKVKVSHESLSVPNGVLAQGKSFPAKITNGVANEKTDAKEANKLAKRERRKARAGPLNETHLIPSGNHAGEEEEGELIHENKNKRKAKKHSDRRLKDSQWQVSDAVGGCLIDVDPVFSLDEKNLLLAYESHVAVYDTSNSLRIRTLATKKTHGSITAVALSAINPSELYVTLSRGLIERWKWKEGRRIGTWALSSKLYDIAVTKRTIDDKELDFVFTIDSKNNSWFITVHILQTAKEPYQTEAHTLLKSSEPIMNLNIQGEADVLVASAGRRLMIGALNSSSIQPLKDMLYTWREFDCSEWISSLDARFHIHSVGLANTKGDGSSFLEVGSVDIAVGGIHGSIFIYRDILRDLVRKERKKQLAPPVAERLHWHRNGVGAVKWSADGNYVISGGIETVMVLWQLDTGQKQFLPHLSAPIESLVVSPSGASYAVRLADNSAMVLSTAELQPTVSILGIQLATSTQPKFKVPVVSQISETIQASLTFRRPAVAISKDMPGSVLLAVTGASSSRIGVTTNVNAAYLQSVDVRSGSQLSRQALTRTKVTDRIIGPELNILEEPNIVLLQVSEDGAWMATVEEWIPPQKDVDVLVPDQESVPTEQISRMEIYLKFWHWDAESMNWELVARVEAPHNTNDCDRVSVGRVLDLIPGPSSSGFVTIGDEGQAKLWRPKARYRDGVKVKGVDGQTLINWTCYQNILLPGLHGSLDKQIMARLALSDDGSLLVVGYRSESQSLIFMIDVVEGTVQHVYSAIFTGPLIGLGVLDKYLIILADQLIVWDIVDDQYVHIISLTSYGLAERNRISATHLAIDRISMTFAVSVPEIVTAEWLTTLQTQLVIFDPAHPSRLYHTSFPHTLKALIPSVHRNGFISIDTTAHVRTISRTAELPTVQEGPTPEKGKVKGLANIYGDAFSNILKGTKQVENAQLLLKNGISESRQATTEEGERAVVRKEALTDIFERGHPFALPPVTKIFEQVAKLFIGKATR